MKPDRIKNWPKRERPRERLIAEGPEHLTDAELLAIVLRVGRGTFKTGVPGDTAVTLAHLLMRQMSLDCGYSSASLRERIYSDENMAGLLIYTSTPDSDGSLGGLVRQTKPPQKFGDVLMSSVDLAQLCSSDPLCREHNPQRTQRLNGAACHACAMVSETSCEFGNRLLDRAMVVNLPDKPTGYFDSDD